MNVHLCKQNIISPVWNSVQLSIGEAKSVTLNLLEIERGTRNMLMRLQSCRHCREVVRYLLLNMTLTLTRMIKLRLTFPRESEL